MKIIKKCFKICHFHHRINCRSPQHLIFISDTPMYIHIINHKQFLSSRPRCNLCQKIIENVMNRAIACH